MASASWTIQQMRPEHLDEARELLVDIFSTQEPITKALGATRADTCELYSRSKMQSYLKYQISVVAMTQTNEIIGVRFLDGEFSLPTEADGPKMKPYCAIVHSLVSCIGIDKNDQALISGESTTCQEKWLHFLILTSKYSLKIALKLGFKLKAFIKRSV